MQFVSAAEAVQSVESGSRLYVHGMAAAPHGLLSALCDRAADLRGVELFQLHTEGPAPYAVPAMCDAFHVNALFVSSNIRQAVREGRADYVPVFLSEVPALFRTGRVELDAALVHLSPPDRHGFCSLGVSVEAARAAIGSARRVIAQVNPHMPRTHGDGLVNVDSIAAACWTESPIPEVAAGPSDFVSEKIASHVASLVEDGSTLQMGIGAIPSAVLTQLKGHRHLGVHSEMFSDSLIDLIECGAVDGSLKKVHPGKIVSTFLMGTRRLYDFVDDNPLISLLDAGYVNDTAVIRRNPKVVAINSALEIDLTGQVCADSIGTSIYSGVGGQMDFMRGASLSDGGKPIIALPSTTSKGESKIVPTLRPGAGVVTTRAHVHYVVTEHGVANLYGKGLRERARSLIRIADPSAREPLEKAAAERFGTL